jgi:hypothetical protein
METVKRLAANVSPRSTNQDSTPALVSSGSLSVATRAAPRRSDPNVAIAAKKALLFQVLLSVIRLGTLAGRNIEPGIHRVRQIRFEFLV